MRIISYNVNGIRAAMKKGLVEWISAANPDVLCVQELKAQKGDWQTVEFENLGYQIVENNAHKKGYSGTAIFSKYPLKNVVDTALDWVDNEGRVISADVNGVRVMSVYFPSGTSAERQKMKMAFLFAFAGWLDLHNPSGLPMVIAGDFNICHTEKDIHDPVRLNGVPGFTPEERNWLTDFLDSGWVDSFRAFNQEGSHYSWWSYMGQSRQRNKGWRIDYQLVSEDLRPMLKSARYLPKAMHSDHCPLLIDLEV